MTHREKDPDPEEPEFGAKIVKLKFTKEKYSVRQSFNNIVGAIGVLYNGSEEEERRPNEKSKSVPTVSHPNQVTPKCEI